MSRLPSHSILDFARNDRLDCVHVRQTKRGAGDPNDRHASGHKSEWRHFRWVGDLTNGLGQRDSRRENGASTRRHCGNGRNVVPAAGESRGYRQVLCVRGENRANFDTIPVEVWVTRFMTGEELRVTHGVFTLVAID